MAKFTFRGPRILVLSFVLIILTSLYLFYPSDHYRPAHSPMDPYADYQPGGLDSEHWEAPVEPDFERDEVIERPRKQQQLTPPQRPKPDSNVKQQGLDANVAPAPAPVVPVAPPKQHLPPAAVLAEDECDDGVCAVREDDQFREPTNKLDPDYKLRPKPGFSKPKPKPKPVAAPEPAEIHEVDQEVLAHESEDAVVADKETLDEEGGEDESEAEGGDDDDEEEAAEGEAEDVPQIEEHIPIKAPGRKVKAFGKGREGPRGKTITEEARAQADQKEFAGVDQGAIMGDVIMPKLENATAKAELGRSAWHVMHLMTLRYPERPTDDDRAALKSYFHLFSRLYPCGECAQEFQQLLKQYPPQTSSRKTASMWLCSVHNMVNERLGKPEFDCLTLNDVYDCGCGPEGEDADKAKSGEKKGAKSQVERVITEGEAEVEVREQRRRRVMGRKARGGPAA